MPKKLVSERQVEALLARQAKTLKVGQFSQLDVGVLRAMSGQLSSMPSNNTTVTRHFCELLLRVADHLESSGAVVPLPEVPRG